MKSSAKLKSCLQKSLESLLSFLEKPPSALPQKDFHSLRVEIKRIKVIFRLLNACVKKWSWKKKFKPFERVFAQAGRVRELQVQLLMIQSYPKTPLLIRYIAKLKRNTNAEKKKFYNLIDKKLKKQLRKNAKNAFKALENVRRKSVRHFLRKKHYRIHQLLSSEKKASGEIHELRKRIKEIYMLEKMLQPKNKRLAFSDDFQELLGTWHDGVVLLKGLDKNVTPLAHSPSEKRDLQLLKRKISKHNRQLLDSIWAGKIDFNAATHVAK